MRILAMISWAIAVVWLVLALFGAENFQELYGGTSGFQFFILALIAALVPGGLGWWAYRRSKSATPDEV